MTQVAGKPQQNPDNDILTSLAGIIAIPSVKGSATHDAPFGQYTVKALEYMLQLGDCFGFHTVNLDGYAGYIEFGEGAKEVAALCHLDIVPPGDGWTTDPYKLIIEDGKAIGRGTIDDKGPAIACLYAMKNLKDQGYLPRNRIRLILGLDEESGCECITHYRKSQAVPDIGFTPDAKFPVIYAEKGILHVIIKGTPHYSHPSSLPTVDLWISGGDKANMVPSTCRYRLSLEPHMGYTPHDIEMDRIVSGRSSHASLPQYGENAISKAMSDIHQALSLLNANNPFVEFYDKNIGNETDGAKLGIAYQDDESGPLTCNVGLITYDSGSLSLTLDIRYSVTADKSEIMRILARRAAEYGLEIVEDSGMDPLYRNPDSTIVTTLLEVYQSQTGSVAKPIAIGGGTYARRMPNIIAFGPIFDPAHDVAHQAGEYFRLEDFHQCVQIYEKAFKKLDEII